MRGNWDMNVEKYIEDGYIIVETDLIDSDIDLINSEVDRCLTIEDKKTQSNYQYTEFPRLFEAWKQSKPIYNLCKNKNIIDAIELLYGEKCFPFSTINFTGPSNQPLHSDTIHFNTIPQNRMCGVWVALEDTNADNGTLSIVPGSHLWSTHDYQSIGLPHPDTIVDGEKENYRKYEEFIISLVKENNAQAVPICLKKGQALIWEANLLHGGTFTEFKKSRKVQAIHYFLENSETYYHPMFSNLEKEDYAYKWCNDGKRMEDYI